jgi:D-glycero-D-manno-heptose 1,7-bisphosphate phosphatase
MEMVERPCDWSNDPMSGAIFLDRDGTINANAAPGEYILTREQFRFLPRARDALRFLAQNFGGQIVIVTNQSPVGRGLTTLAQVDNLHRWMAEQIWQAGGPIIGVCLCPHTPEYDCVCRKPRPGLFLQAAADFDIDLEQSVAVGDALSDMQAAWAAGIRECYRVRTGLPFEDPLEEAHKYAVVGTLSEAALAIVGKEHADATQ